MSTSLPKALFVLASLALLSACSFPSSSLSSSVSSDQSSVVSESSVSSSSDSPLTSESSSEDGSSVSSESSEDATSSSSIVSDSSEASSDSSPSSIAPYDVSKFSISRDDGLVPEEQNGIYRIVEGGSYSCSGELIGMIHIDVPETDDKSGEVELNLEGVDMSYSGNSVIYCVSADKLEISAKKGTKNVITDLRELETEEVEDQGGGAIYAKVDTKLKGTGSLKVTGTYNNGIHVTKDLEIQKLTLESAAPNNAIKGTDSLTINSGSITAISLGGDGLKTADSDISSKGKQRGDITILGGVVDVYSACDGIQAAHDVLIGSAEDATASPTVTVKTNKFSSYTDESLIQATSEETMYLKTSGNYDYRYAVYFYNSDVNNGVWADATRINNGGGGPGPRSTYYSLSRPASYESFAIYAFGTGTTVNSTTSYKAKSSGNAVNASFDTVSFSISGTSISVGQWSNYSSQGGFPGGGPGFGPGQEGNQDKAEVSAKGIKADNDVHIYGGTIDVTAYDDGIHAKYGEALQNEETSTGDVYIQGGDIMVYASDDGVHADRYLRISGGNINVTNSYEGLEGNQIYVSGGRSVVYASDDGVNANSGTDAARLSALINVSDGYLFCAVPTNGDTDGIDSNGNYVQSGGTVITAGPNSFAAAALDTDGSVQVNGGTLIIFGASERTPSLGSGVTSSTKSGTYGNKVYTVNFTEGSVETAKLPNSSYSSCRGYSVLGSITSIA